MKKLFSGILIIGALCSNAMAESVIGRISELRNHTSTHSNESVRGHTTFRISSELLDPCETLHVPPEDKTAISFLLSAKAQKKDVKIYYHTDKLAPFSSNSCSVYAVDIP